MKTIAIIHVPTCPVCGDHARAEDFDAALMRPTSTAQIGDKGIFVPFLSRCQECGTTACYSCLGDGVCCARQAEIASIGVPKAGQKGLFDGA